MKTFKEFLLEVKFQSNTESLVFHKKAMFPLRPKLISNIFGKQKVRGIHVSGFSNFEGLVKIQNSGKTISAFTDFEEDQGWSLISKGVAGGSGVFAVVEGELIAHFSADFFTSVDNYGYKWFFSYSLEGDIKKIRKSIIKQFKLDVDNWEAVRYIPDKKIKLDIIKAYFQELEKFIKAKKKKVASIIRNPNKKDLDELEDLNTIKFWAKEFAGFFGLIFDKQLTDMDEVNINQFKILKVYQSADDSEFTEKWKSQFNVIELNNVRDLQKVSREVKQWNKANIGKT